MLTAQFDMRYRFATPEDLAALASMNQQLIRDEGHRNAMSLSQLADRMANWLHGEYRAVVFEERSNLVGYALFKAETEYVYLRQLFVMAEHRRKGIARAALEWLWTHAWHDAPRLRIDVLVGNLAGRKFWQSVGFHEYGITMEALNPCGD